MGEEALEQRLEVLSARVLAWPLRDVDRPDLEAQLFCGEGSVGGWLR